MAGIAAWFAQVLGSVQLKRIGESAESVEVPDLLWYAYCARRSPMLESFLQSVRRKKLSLGVNSG